MSSLLPSHHPLPVRAALAHPVTGLVAFVALVAVGIGHGQALARALGASDRAAGTWAELVTCVVAYLVVTLLLEGRRPPAELDPRRVSGLLGGALFGGGLCLLVFTVLWALGWRSIVHLDPGRPMVWEVATYGIVAGIAEELVFRGIGFRVVEHWLGTWGATATSGVGFGLLHLSNPDATATGAVAIALSAGIGLALLFRATGSLWWPIGAHAAWNIVQGPLLGSAISGATANGAGIVVSQPAGPDWLSGGVFGLEATPVAVAAWLVASVVLARRIHRDHLAIPAGWPFRRALSRR